MLGPARYLADFARFVAHKGVPGAPRRSRRSALWKLPHSICPAGLELEWLGVSGYRMTYEGKTLVIDPYVSRVPLSALIRRERGASPTRR